MRKLFIFLLKKYTKREKDRIFVLSVLQEQVRNDYTEQSGFGNIYNMNIEFILSNDIINKYVNDKKEIECIKRGLSNSFDESIEYIKNEPRRKKLNSLNKN